MHTIYTQNKKHSYFEKKKLSTKNCMHKKILTLQVKQKKIDVNKWEIFIQNNYMKVKYVFMQCIFLKVETVPWVYLVCT